MNNLNVKPYQTIMKNLFLCIFTVVLTLPLLMSGQTTVTIGTETNSTTTSGGAGGITSNGAAYSYTQQIYTAEELADAGVPAGALITGIAFYNGTNTATTMHGIHLYLGHCEAESFMGVADYVSASQLMQVDSSDWVATAYGGWITKSLSTPFAWNGVDNLVVAVAFSGATAGGVNCGWRYSTYTGHNRQWRRFLTQSMAGASYCADPSYVASTTPDNISFNVSVGSSRANMQITYVLPDCPSLTPTVVAIGPDAAMLSWVNHNQSASSWDLLYGVDGTFDTQSGGTLQTNITDTVAYLTGLTPLTNYKVYLKSHCSSGVGTWSSPLYFTTTVPCPPVSDLHVESVSSNHAVVAWNPGWSESSCDLYLSTTNTAPTDSTPPTYVATSPMYTLQGLATATQYYLWVRANCGASDHSTWTPLAFMTSQVPATLPYTQNWENGEENARWGFVNGSNANQWYIGNATNATDDGDSSLYISNNNGLSNDYTITASSDVWAYRDIDFGNYAETTIGFDFRGYGESGYDYMRVYVGLPAFPYGDNVPDGAVQIGPDINLHNDYTRVELVLDGSYHGVHRLYFLWHNDALFGDQPPAAVDNISIRGSNCARPYALQVDSVTTNTIAFHFTPASSLHESWQVVIMPYGTPIDSTLAVSITSPHYEFMGLSPNTVYDIYAKTECGDANSNWSEVLSVSTECATISSFPYVETFSSYGMGDHTHYPYCWTRYQTASTTQYPYISTTDGGSLIFFSNSTATVYGASPVMNLTGEASGSLMLSFDVYKSVAGYGRLNVGYMTDPEDFSTFHLIKSIYPGDLEHISTWYHMSVAIPDHAYLPEVYFVFQAPISGVTNYVWLDNVAVEYRPACFPPSNFEVSQVAGTSALLTWHEPPYEVADYTIEYAVAGTGNYQFAQAIGTQYMLSDLVEQTAYDVMLYSNCGADPSDTLMLSFTTNCLAGGTVPFTTGDISSYYLPVNNYYNFTYSQQIYLASEMNGPVDINSISFEYAHTTDMSAKNNVDIYLGHTTKSSFSSTSDYISDTALHLVYHGSLNCQQGWNEFVLDSVFHYNGTDNLVLAVDDNSGSYNGFDYVFRVHAAGGYRSLYYFGDSFNPSPADPTAVSTTPSFSSGIRSNVIFGGTCNQEVTCIAPNVYVESVDDNSATIAWAPGSSETSWTIECKATYEPTWTTLGVVTSSPAVLHNMTPNTTYQVRMRSNCDNGDHSHWSTVTVSIPCFITSLPYTEDMNSATGNGSTNSIPCWTKKSNSAIAYPYPSNTYAHSSPYSLYFNGSSSTYSMAVSPRFDDSIEMDSLHITFWSYKTSANYFVEVGVMSDPNDISTFELVGSFSPSTTSTWEKADVFTRSYHGNGHYVAFRIPQWMTSYQYVDDISIDYIPVCVSVENLEVSSITPFTAEVSWDAGSDESTWEILYGADVDFNADMPIIVHSESYSLNNLLPNTLYEVYVRAVCPSGDYSSWQLVSFRTACAPVTTLPFIEDFDTYGTGDPAYPSCWGKINTFSSNRPYISSTHYAGVGSLYFFAGDPGTYNIAICPEFDASIPVNSLQASFKYRAISDKDYLLVGVMTDPEDATTFFPVDTIMPDSTASAWIDAEVSFADYAGTGQYIAFKNQYTSTYCYGLIDNLMIDLIPSCVKPTNVTATAVTHNSVTLAWTENGSSTSWEVVYGPAGFSIGSAAAVVDTANNNPFTISDLNSTTAYDFYVRSICGLEEYSSFSPVYHATTACEVIDSLPYVNTFDTYGTGVGTYPTCWGKVNTYSFDRPYVSPVNYAGAGSLYFYAGSENTYNLAATPLVSPNISVNTLSATFMYRANNGSDRLIVGVMTNPTDATTFEPIDTILPDANPVNWVEKEVSFYHYNGVGQYIAFKNEFTAVGTYSYIDNLVVDLLPSCAKPMHLAATEVDTTSVTLTWQAGGPNHTAYEIVYGPAGFSLADGTGTVVNVPAPPFTLSGLTPATNYDFYVRAACEPGEYSNYSDVCHVSTDCESMVLLPYIENFDTYAFGSYPDCWKRYNTYSFDRPSVSSTHFAGEGSLFFYTEVGTSNIAVAPKFAPTIAINSLQATFMYRANYTTDRLFVGVMENPADVSTFVPVDSVYPAANPSTWIECVVDFSQYSGAGRYIAFMNVGDIYEAFAYIDELVVETIPTCPKPSSIEISNVTNNSAQVIWTPVGVESLWNVEYKETTSSTWTVVPVSASLFNLTGLAPGTSYDVRVQANCGSGDLSSYRETSFQTAICSSANQCDYFFSMSDDFGDGWNGATVSVMQNGVQVAAVGAGFYDGGYLGQTVHLCDNIPAILIWNAGSHDDECSFTMAGPDGTVLYVSPSTLTDTLYFFNVDCGSAPQNCVAPTGLSVGTVGQNTATVTWTAGGAETSWEVQYKVATASNWQTATANSSVYTLTGLTPATSYNVKVRAVCDANVTSDWSSSVTFTTANTDTPTCPAPYSLTCNVDHTNVTLTWQQEPNTANEWQINYRQSTESTWNTVTATTTSYTLIDLAANVQYVANVVAHCTNGLTSGESNTVTFETNNIGIEDYLAKAVKLYPNPATQLVNVECEAGSEATSIEVYNVYGQLLMTLGTEGQHVTQIPVSGLADGMYYVRVTTAMGVVTKNFVKR